MVKAALDAAKAGSAIVVPGAMNKVTANVLPRIFPRFASLRSWRDRYSRTNRGKKKKEEGRKYGPSKGKDGDCNRG